MLQDTYLNTYVEHLNYCTNIGALILLAVKLLLPFILHLPLVEAFILLFGQPLFSYSVQLRLAQVESV